MKLQKLNRALAGALLVSGALGVASQAQALTITPSTTPVYTTNQTSALTASEIASAVGYMGTLGLVFKQDEPSPESGIGAPYYTAGFSYDMDGEPIGATITWDGPLFVACPSCYLVVKDGAQGNPAQYIFDLSNSWDGKETIELSGFWDGTQGAISNIAIWNDAYPGGGGGGSLVPEPETYAMLLAGLGLVGFAARRKLSKTA